METVSKQPKTRTTRQYKMSVAGQLFRHLGLQMYSGAVPALSELISNSYDAMAGNVWLTLPAGRSIRLTDEIVVRDDGHGMSFDDCNALYLSVGRDRRSSGQWTQEYNSLPSRKIQGRKGIGKLAGFGIANRIKIKTTRNREVSHFVLDFSDLTTSANFSDARGYSPQALDEDGTPTSGKPGTVVTLSQLKITRAVDEGQFKRSIARRLLVLAPDFTVHINDTPISRQEIPFQFRFPDSPDTWETSQLPNGQEFQWWGGFCQDPIPDEEQRGFVVYVRGKLAQAPWFFDLSGGVWGQHGMQYLTGEIQADFLDDNVDLIATDRGTVRWEDPIAQPLKEWGQKRIRLLLESWTERRREAKQKSPRVVELLQQAGGLPEKERSIFRSAVNRICSIPQLDSDDHGHDIAEQLVEFCYNAMTNRSFLEAIRRLNTASPDEVEEFTKVLSEWDVIELVSTAQLVKGRVEIIRKFKEMIGERVREKPDMQNYVRDHPWLIDPKWTTLVHEKSLDTLLENEFNVETSRGAEGVRRVDFFCLGDKYKTAHVVEVKRPGDTVGRPQFDQIRDYVLFLRRKLERDANQENARTTIGGLLIADRIREEDSMHAQEAQKAGTFEIRTWDSLLTAAETLHEEFLTVVRTRAPADDPRIASL